MAQIDTTVIENMLHYVRKPARYAGGELNIIVKPGPSVRMALCYPDLYEIGMSNSGMRILYDRANGMEGVSCERVFAVEEDFERMLRDHAVPLYTLETFTPLHEMDIVGFNISHELLFTNVLQVLDLGKIPLTAKERNDRDPLVIAGGEAVSNPWPASDFIDVFFMGDGEEGIADIINALKKAKSLKLDRRSTLALIGEIEGVLIPADYAFRYDGIRTAGMAGKKVKRRVMRGSEPPDPAKPVVPNIRISQDRAVVEVARGCSNLCRFCHACYFNLPYRFYDAESVRERISSLIRNTGYSEVTLSSLSVSDYLHLDGLINILLPGLTEAGTSISLPSLRVDLHTLPVIGEISDLRKTSLTFAVESASEELRRISGKQLSTDDLLNIVEHVFARGWHVIKLYFMIGLPGCGNADEAGEITGLLRKIAGMAKGKKEINVTVSPFVPKPHTPFQREKMMDEDYFRNTVARIRRGMPRQVNIKHHDIDASLLEGLFSRADARLGAVIQEAYLAGCRFDSWEEHLRPEIWHKALGRLMPEWKGYLCVRAEDEILPWSCVETGYEDLAARTGGADARQGRGEREGAGEEKILDPGPLSEAKKRFTAKYEVKTRARLRFSKTGLAKFIPHIDFIEIVKRALRMAGAPVSFSQGFNKRERISAGYALSVGIESEAELCDADLYGGLAPDFAARISAALPAGISFRGWEYIDGKDPLTAVIDAVSYRIQALSVARYAALLANIRNRPDIVRESKRTAKTVPFGDVILGHEVTGPDSLRLILSAKGGGPARVDDVVLSLADTDRKDMHLFRLIKECQYRGVNGSLVSI